MGVQQQWDSVIQDVTASTKELDKYDSALRKHVFAATIGKSKRPGLGPAPCPVHSYNQSLSTLRETAVKFGSAARGLNAELRTPCSVHTYSAVRSSLTPKSNATFGRAKTGRAEPPRTICGIHSYMSDTVTPRRPLKMVGTFGTATARGDAMMTRSGLLIAAAKPASLAPLHGGDKHVASSTSQAIGNGVASRLRRKTADERILTEMAGGVGYVESSTSDETVDDATTR